MLNIFKKRIRKLIRFFQILHALLLRRPVSRIFGTERGTPIDRFYIEDFLQKNSNAIHGDVLEIAENIYTLKYGHAPLNSHILHVSSDNPNATLIGNLETGENIPVSSFDCIILTQTLPFIYDVRAVLKHSYLALKPNGTLLLTLPLIAQISRYDMDRWGDGGSPILQHSVCFRSFSRKTRLQSLFMETIMRHLLSLPVWLWKTSTGRDFFQQTMITSLSWGQSPENDENSSQKNSIC